jgi:hypothetical protein
MDAKRYESQVKPLQMFASPLQHLLFPPVGTFSKRGESPLVQLPHILPVLDEHVGPESEM